MNEWTLLGLHLFLAGRGHFTVLLEVKSKALGAKINQPIDRSLKEEPRKKKAEGLREWEKTKR